jgi:MFS family permease
MENKAQFSALFLLNFAITLGFGITDAFFTVYIQDLGARGIMLGLPIVFYSLAKIFFCPVMGSWSDRIGRRTLIIASLCLYTTISLCFLITTNLVVISVLRLLQGAGCAMFRPVLQSLTGELSPSARRATTMGTFDISFYSALSIGPVIGGLVKDQWGFEGIFIVLAILCLSALCIALVSVPGNIPVNSVTPRSGTLSQLFNTLQASKHQGDLRGLLAFIFGRACGISAFGAFVPILLSNKLQLKGMETGLIMASATVVITLLLRPMGMLSDKIPRRPLVIVGGLAASLLYFGIPLADSFHEMLLLGIGIGFFSVVSQPASTALLVEEGILHGIGITVGLFNAVLNTGFVVGPLAGALLMNNYGVQSVFYASGIAGLLSVIIFLVWMKPESRATLPKSVLESNVLPENKTISLIQKL